MGDTMRYETVAQRAARTGQPPAVIRRDAAEGRIPGAIRVGSIRSPWALPIDPDNDDTPAPVEARVSRTQTGTTGMRPHLMSTGDGMEPVTTARRVAQRVSVVP